MPATPISSKEFKSSSSPALYTTTIYSDCISCTCQGGARKQLCKHMVELVHEQIDNIQLHHPALAEKIIAAMSAKNDPSINKNDRKGIYEKVIFVSREMADSAFEISLLSEIDLTGEMCKKRSDKFISTTENAISNIEYALKIGLITVEDYNLGLSFIKNSLDTIKNYEFKIQ